MKLSVPSFRRGLFATALAFGALTAVSAADTFEGRVHMEITSGKKDPQAIDYAIKDGKLRCDMPPDSARRGGGMGGMIFDFKNQEMIILMEHGGQKNFIRRSLAQTIASASAKAQGEHPAGSAPVATGRTEMIAGYLATEYKITGEKGDSYELWLAKGLGTFMLPSAQGPMGGRGAPSPEWEQMARDGGFFPLRVVTRDAGGVERSRMEVTKIDKTPLPDSLFSTDGYSEFKIPDFGGGFNPFKH
jgi:hypothetical protein